MNGQIAAGVGVLTAVMVGAVFLARYWRPARPAPQGGRHRAPAVVPVPECEVLPRVEALVLRTAPPHTWSSRWAV
jgi:hypothetical protein